MLNKFYVKKEFFIQNREVNIKDHYQILQVTGRGAFATVYKAKLKYYPYLIRAVKRIKKSFVKNPEDILNQYEIMTSLDHPMINKIYQTFEDADNFFMVLDYCQGGELFKRLQKQGNFTQTNARKLFTQMAQCINYLHENHVAHRDLKPQNFILMSKESLDLMLIDFGLAFRWKKDMKKENVLKPGHFVGTAYYMAPEVYRGEPYDERCDIYSLGIILFMMVTGEPPVKGYNSAEVMQLIRAGQLNLHVMKDKRLNVKLIDLVHSMLKPQTHRISMADILKHPWMNMQLKQQKMNINFERIRSFSQFSNFRVLVMNFIASQLPQKDIMMLGKVFMEIDKNKDGTLTVQQITNYLQINGHKPEYKQIHKIIASLDVDNNGSIAYNQFISACLSKSASNNREYLQYAFRFFDLNGDGKISRKELETVLKAYERDFSDNKEMIEVLLRECDTNGDEQIDFEQFCNYLMAGPDAKVTPV